MGLSIVDLGSLIFESLLIDDFRLQDLFA